MWGWIIAGLVTFLGTFMVWHYRSASANAELAGLIEQNKAAVDAVGAVLTKMSEKANAETERDRDEAKATTTTQEAADFLNASGGPSPGPGSNDGLRQRGPSARGPSAAVVLPSRRRTPSPPIHGFARGQGDDVPAERLRPGSILEG